MSEISIPWPGKNDKAFTEGVLGPTQAYLECFKYLLNDIPIADGFKDAADQLVDYLASGECIGHPDKFFFPIAYLYGHGLELYLKSLVNDGIDLGILERDSRIEKLLGTHNLYELWKKVRIILQEFWPNGDPSDLTAVENIVGEFHRLDASGQKLRYSRDKQGNPNLRTAPSHVELTELKRVVAGLFSFLDACSNGLGEAKDWHGNY